MNTKSIKLGSRNISNLTAPYVIAEIGVNHEGSLEIAKKLILEAKEAGADAAKFQSYKADKIASKNSDAYWDITKEPTKNQYQLFKKYDFFGVEEYYLLSEYCKELEIDFLSTPFDHDAVEFLNPIMPFFKIASADITNIPLIKLIASKNKPIILSTGASNVDEIDFAIDIIKKHGLGNIVLLHCILNYPTEEHNANLRMITNLSNRYKNYLIGYSDHTLPDKDMNNLVTAYLLGSVVIEKHFTHDKSLKGNDHYHAMDKNDLKNFISRIQKLNETLGNYHIKQPIFEEEISRKNARRSLVLNHKMKKGTLIKEKDLICKRPGTGISPVDIGSVINKVINKDLEEDHILLWEDLES
jgi:N-acetylneuraminate synthase